MAGTSIVTASGPTVIVLASGRGERFAASGGQTHKLQSLLGGKTVLQRTLDAVADSGLDWHLVDQGYPGMGDSIAAGVRATAQSSGWLILPADLPLIQPDSLRAVAVALQTSTVAIPTCKGEKGHPVGFGRVCYRGLASLSGPQGAAKIIQQYQAAKVAVQDIGILTDIDTVDDLRRAQVLRIMGLFGK